MSFYHYAPKDHKGDAFSFTGLKGKVVLIVNVASKCGFSHQYKELEALNHKYSEKGFQIIAFPCNQFGAQEPGSDVEIITFCSRNYGVTFPVLRKIKVNGAEAEPVYKFLTQQKRGLFGLKRVSWNFEKFLINRAGKVTGRFSTFTRPFKMSSRIEKLLEDPTVA